MAYVCSSVFGGAYVVFFVTGVSVQQQYDYIYVVQSQAAVAASSDNPRIYLAQGPRAIMLSGMTRTLVLLMIYSRATGVFCGNEPTSYLRDADAKDE